MIIIIMIAMIVITFKVIVITIIVIIIIMIVIIIISSCLFIYLPIYLSIYLILCLSYIFLSFFFFFSYLPNSLIVFPQMMHRDVEHLLRTVAIVVAVMVAATAGQSARENEFGCNCMEYWKCITRCVGEVEVRRSGTEIGIG